MSSCVTSTFRLAAALAIIGGAAASLAVSPQTVQHATEADLAAGELHSVAISSQGELRLGREVSFLLTSDKAPTVISALTVRGKTVFAASGSDSAIYRIQDGKVGKDKFATIPDATMIGSLLATDKEIFAGASGEKGAGIYRIDDKGKAVKFWSEGDVQYVWSIVAGEGGTLYAATGPKGQVWAIDAQGKGTKLFEAKDLAKNVLCLAVSGGTLYAGTDEKGLVVAIDLARKTSRVLLSAPEKEISAIVPHADGNVYVATSDSAKAASDGTDQAEPGERRGPQSLPVGNIIHIEAATKPGAPKSAPASAAADDDEPGELPTASPSRPGPSMPMLPRMPRGQGFPGGSGESGEGPGLEGPGNAVYRIAPDGLVRPLIRRPVSIYAMMLAGDELLLATGPSGQIVAVKLAGDDSTVIADTDASQITALAAGEGGAVMFASSNKGSVGALAKVTAKSGTYLSKPIDAQQIAKWGTVRVRASVPEKARLTLATRTGNLAEPKDNTWSGWSDEIPVTDSFLRIASPAGRFLQYRLTFAAEGDSPRASDVRVIYQVGNLAPEITELQVTPSATEEGGPGPMPMPRGRMPGGAPGAGPGAGPADSAAPPGPQYFRSINITATDPNSDTLTYTLEYRQVGTANWIKIADKLDRPTHAWDSRTVGDGTYEFRVTAGDAPSNPPAIALTAAKVSAPVVVDNTAPAVKDLAAKVDGAKVSITGLATDAGSRIASLHYSLDSATEWTMVLPEGGICDSDKAKLAFEVKGVKPGTHRLTVRAADAFGNTGFATVTVEAK